MKEQMKENSAAIAVIDTDIGVFCFDSWATIAAAAFQ